ncbi:hypothetical protein [Thalassobaculum sp.]|uniref:NACHT domain-containing protein n=1 Tax=Thalassobaculum sp. TaxID=2022740 RepID=UPI0032EC0A0D
MPARTSLTLVHVLILTAVLTGGFVLIAIATFADESVLFRAGAGFGGVALIFGPPYYLRLLNPEANARRRLAAGLLAIALVSLSTATVGYSFSMDLLERTLGAVSFQQEPWVRGILLALAAFSIWLAYRLLVAPHTTKANEGPLGDNWSRDLNSSIPSSFPRSHKDLHDHISDEFGINSLILVSRYIEPDCQSRNPSDFHDDNPATVFRQPVSRYLREFLRKAFVEKDGSHVLFVLSDAGMGKSSLLAMLRLTSFAPKLWPASIKIELLKLDESTLSNIQILPDKNTTVLLLDALDEDPLAYGRIEYRLSELLDSTTSFRQVIITVRTQFFPNTESDDRDDYTVVAGYRCSLIYISPFTDQQVDAFLLKVFPNRLLDFLVWGVTGKNNKRIEAARHIVRPMKTLRMRPMLLAHIESLMEAPEKTQWTEYTIYDALVNRWLERESRKLKSLSPSSLRHACEIIAIEMQKGNKRKLGNSEFKSIAKKNSILIGLGDINVKGRSLLNRTSSGEWRFSHYTIQEFLIVSYLMSNNNIPENIYLKATDQIINFIEAMGTHHSHILKFFDFTETILRGIPFYQNSIKYEPELEAIHEKLILTLQENTFVIVNTEKVLEFTLEYLADNTKSTKKYQELLKELAKTDNDIPSPLSSWNVNLRNLYFVYRHHKLDDAISLRSPFIFTEITVVKSQFINSKNTFLPPYTDTSYLKRKMNESYRNTHKINTLEYLIANNINLICDPSEVFVPASDVRVLTTAVSGQNWIYPKHCSTP